MEALPDTLAPPHPEVRTKEESFALSTCRSAENTRSVNVGASAPVGSLETT